MLKPKNVETLTKLLKTSCLNFHKWTDISIRMRYTLFLMDLDDTLFDFKQSERKALSSVFLSVGLHDRFEHYSQIYSKINEKLWSDFAKGLLTKDFLKSERFRIFFETVEIDSHHPVEIGDFYLEELGKCGDVIPDAIQVCEQIKKFGKIGIVTNGIEKVQAKKLSNSGLDKVIDFVVSSEKCGFQKPDPRFFHHALEVAGHSSKEDVVVVGDKLEIDVLGALNTGVSACWFNPEKQLNSTPYIPHHEISLLVELHTL